MIDTPLCAMCPYLSTDEVNIYQLSSFECESAVACLKAVSQLARIFGLLESLWLQSPIPVLEVHVSGLSWLR